MSDISSGSKRLCAGLALLSLIILFVVVAGNIIARIIFDLTNGQINFLIEGAIELSSYALLIMVFGALPIAVPDGLVRVDFVTDRLPPLIMKCLNLIWYMILTTGSLTLTWLFIQSGLKAMKRGAVTQDLEIPLSIFYFVICVEMLAMTLVVLAAMLTQVGLVRADEKAGPLPGDNSELSI